jgi:hypothetical protein
MSLPLPLCHLFQVRLCLEKKDFIRAQILSRKVSPKAFVERRGEAKGEIGIEGTAIEAPDDVSVGEGRDGWEVKNMG